MTKLDAYRWLADTVLVVHFGFVAFVVGGFVLIWLGWARRWSWVRGFSFRVAHLMAMGVVLAEALGGVICPLTDWEDRLRWMAGEGAQPTGSFIQRWIHRIIFYDVSETSLAIVYALFFGLVLASLWIVKPRWPWAARAGSLPKQQGIRLDMTHPFWELSGESDFPSLLRALPDLLPEGSVLYFEGGSPSGKLLEFLRQHVVPERAHVAYGTIWPKPMVFHVPATSETMRHLAVLTESCAYPELAIHFHVYRDQTVLLEWHDAFTQPMLLSGELPEHSVKTFAERLQMSHQKGNVEQSPEGNAVPPRGPA